MADKKKFLLRIDTNVYASLEKWAADDLRSINAQIEFLLAESLKKNGRLKQTTFHSLTKNELNNNPDTNN
jgi:hypothetical protein